MIIGSLREREGKQDMSMNALDNAYSMSISTMLACLWVTARQIRQKVYRRPCQPTSGLGAKYSVHWQKTVQSRHLRLSAAARGPNGYDNTASLALLVGNQNKISI